VGGDDDSGTSASHTTSLPKSISSLNSSGSPKTSGHKKSTQLTTKANLSGPRQHGLWKRRVTLPYIQLPDQGGAHVFDGYPTQQIGHNPRIRPTPNYGRQRHIVLRKGGIATAKQDLFGPFDCAAANAIALYTREDVSIHLSNLTFEPTSSSSTTFHEDCNLEC